MLESQTYITNLKKFLGHVEVVEKSDSIQIHDGVDIIYSLVVEANRYSILISERGTVSSFCTIQDTKFAQIYFAIFVKNTLADIKLPLMPKIEDLTEELETLLDLFNQEGLAPYYSVDSVEAQRVNLSTASKRLYYVDASGREYDIAYLPNRFHQTFYSSIVNLENRREWLTEWVDYSDAIQKYEATLLGFSSEGIVK
ncbi:hypothetical protein [uncultured Granulicatella sp.]|uniref:hypothetical protein n=1 Tax=uncultured Granulicatella sp. TaxID=316089 RepID=UPI00260C6375|nr:hypothetical protein [uncultured Granulicatella sp.]